MNSAPRRARIEVENFEKLKKGASNLSVNVQLYFWTFLSNQVKFLLTQKSSVFYDVLTETSPNPLGSAASVEASGIFAVIMRSARVLVIPLQKAVQYYAWYNANKDYESRYAANMALLEERKRILKTEYDAYEDTREETQRKMDIIDERIRVMKQENAARDPNEVGGMKKPTFTLNDGLYLLLDIALLALAIAALVYGASITGAAIATAAAAVSVVAASINYGKYLYDGYQLTKEKKLVDELLENENKEPGRKRYLTQNDRDFIEAQRMKAEQEHPGVDLSSASDVAILQMRSDSLGSKLKENIQNRYQTIRKTLGFALTMTSIISASLILGGLMLGPVGVPVIMAGVGLGIITTVAAVTMMVVNMIKKNRETKKAQESAKDSLDIEMEKREPSRITPSNRVINDRIYSADKRPDAAEPPKYTGHVDENDEDELPNPFHPAADEKVSNTSLFHKSTPKRTAQNDPIEMKQLPKLRGNDPTK